MTHISKNTFEPKSTQGSADDTQVTNGTTRARIETRQVKTDATFNEI